MMHSEGVRSFRYLCRSLGLLLLASSFASGQLIYHEGFNDDGDGKRYDMTFRGQLVGPDGPGAWEHNWLVDALGFPSTAPDKRAAILWSNEAIEDDFTEGSLAIWENLFEYMLDGKEEATIGFLPDILAPTPDFLSFMLEDAGHTVVEVPGGGDLPHRNDLDLIIHTSGGNPGSAAAFARYRVPLITYNAQNHDDTLISTIGSTTTGGPGKVTLNPEYKDHPILDGLEGEIQWVDELFDQQPLQGIGGATPPGSKVLATYVDPATQLELPALLLIDKGDDLLGAFAPVGEGAGYIVGGDLNLDLGDGAPSESNPASVVLNAIDLSDHEDVKVSVDLAATTVDFEPVDFLRVSYANGDSEDFVTLAQFNGLDDPASPSNKSLVDPDLGPLVADEFTTFEFDIPNDVDELVLKFEAFSTWPNEILGIDNVRVFGAADPLDCNGDGVVDAKDFDCSNEAGVTTQLIEALGLLRGDMDGMNGVDFADFLVLSNNFGTDASKYNEGNINEEDGVDFGDFLELSNNFGQGAAAASVPEPSGLLLTLCGVGLAMLRRRRR